MQSNRHEEGTPERYVREAQRELRVRPIANQTSSIVVHTPFGRGGKEEAWDVLLGQLLPSCVRLLRFRLSPLRKTQSRSLGEFPVRRAVRRSVRLVSLSKGSAPLRSPAMMGVTRSSFPRLARTASRPRS